MYIFFFLLSFIFCFLLSSISFCVVHPDVRVARDGGEKRFWRIAAVATELVGAEVAIWRREDSGGGSGRNGNGDGGIGVVGRKGEDIST